MGPGTLVAVGSQPPVRHSARLGGLEPEPRVLLADAVIERFILTAAANWSSAARRTVRSNLLFLAHRFFAVAPDPTALGRERAQDPYTESDLARYLALADAQPTVACRAERRG